ncbi:MAG: hypothetical protein ACTSUG_13925, partial [Candidatus Helarchaeota archaeon]
LGIPYTKWGFMGDDHGNIYNCIIKSYKDILNFFTQGITGNLYIPSNGTTAPQNFLSGAYRPMSFIYYGFQYFLFQTNAYGYFLITIFLHTINAILLFNLLTFCIPLFLSFLLSLFFAFHPSLWNWLGWISAQTYQIELLTLFLIIFSLKKYIDSKKIFFYLSSCLLFLSNLFLKEQTIFLPIWLIFAIYLYLQTKEKKNTVILKNITKSLILSIGYWVSLAIYMLTRYFVLTFNEQTGTSNIYLKIISILQIQQERFFDFVTYTSDIFNLTLLPQHHPIIKGTVIVVISSTLLILFLKNSKKTLLLFLYSSILIFSWPGLLLQYQPRYLYMSIPFFIIALVISVKYCNIKIQFKRYYKPLIMLLFLILILQAIFLIKKLKLRENVLNTMTSSFKSLIKNQIILDNIKAKKPICFLALPRYWTEGDTAQAMWLYNKNSSYPVYIYNLEIREKGRVSYREIPKLDKNYLEIKAIKNGFSFKTLNTNKVWFLKDKKYKTDHAIIKIPKKYLLQNPLFIAWNYKKAKFRILDVKKRAKSPTKSGMTH